MDFIQLLTLSNGRHLLPFLYYVHCTLEMLNIFDIEKTRREKKQTSVSDYAQLIENFKLKINVVGL